MRQADLPDTMKTEHEELQARLVEATKAGGQTGEAARGVMKVLFPHILLEEEFAIPPLKLLPRLAAGEYSPDMDRILAKSEMLKAELPRMLAEHKLIVDALQKLLQAATAERFTGWAAFAQKLILHAQKEEEVYYPAAILVGEYIKLRKNRS
jgi:hemerythrin superfamily protein